jgi:hypothetical protein
VGDLVRIAAMQGADRAEVAMAATLP